MSELSGRVVKHNYLIESRYDLSVEETRLFLLAVVQIKRDDEDFKEYQIPVSKFADAVGLAKGGDLYRRLKHTTKSLTERSIEVESLGDKSRKYVQWPLLQEAQYDEGEGIIRLTLNPKLKPYFLQLRERFTTYQIQNVLRFKSAYSTRIYEMLKQYETIGRIRLDLRELRARLKLEDKYQRFSDLRRFVIDKAQSELEKHADICFDYAKVKEGRKIVALKFTIKQNTKNQPASDKELPDSKKKILQERRDRLRKELDTLDPVTYEEIREKALGRLNKEVLRSKNVSRSVYERTVDFEMINVMIEEGY